MAVKTQVLIETKTGRALLIDWANQQDNWIRAAVAEIIESQTRLTDEQVEGFYQMLLREKELVSGDAVNIPMLVETEIDTDPEQVLMLTQVAQVQNVS